MLRMIGLTLVVVAAAAKVAHAESWYDRPAVNGLATTLQESPTTREAALDGYESEELQIGGGLGFTPAGHDQRGSGYLDLAQTDRQVRGHARGLARGRSAGGRSDGWLNFGAANKPTLALSVSESLSLGLGYQYQSSENMNFRLAKVGGLDPNYHGHNFMIRARWEF